MCAQLAAIMARMDTWTFDMFELERATTGRPLSFMAFALFKRMDLIPRFGIDEQKLIRWARLGLVGVCFAV